MIAARRVPVPGRRGGHERDPAGRRRRAGPRRQRPGRLRLAQRRQRPASHGRLLRHRGGAPRRGRARRSRRCSLAYQTRLPVDRGDRRRHRHRGGHALHAAARQRRRDRRAGADARRHRPAPAGPAAAVQGRRHPRGPSPGQEQPADHLLAAAAAVPAHADRRGPPRPRGGRAAGPHHRRRPRDPVPGHRRRGRLQRHPPVAGAHGRGSRPRSTGRCGSATAARPASCRPSVATPLAVVITELLQNAAEHAFPRHEDGAAMTGRTARRPSARRVRRRCRSTSSCTAPTTSCGSRSATTASGLPPGFSIDETSSLGPVDRPRPGRDPAGRHHHHAHRRRHGRRAGHPGRSPPTTEPRARPAGEPGGRRRAGRRRRRRRDGPAAGRAAGSSRSETAHELGPWLDSGTAAAPQEARRCRASQALRSLRRSSSEVPPQMPDSWLVTSANSRQDVLGLALPADRLGRVDLLDRRARCCRSGRTGRDRCRGRPPGRASRRRPTRYCGSR